MLGWYGVIRPTIVSNQSADWINYSPTSYLINIWFYTSVKMQHLDINRRHSCLFVCMLAFVFVWMCLRTCSSFFFLSFFLGGGVFLSSKGRPLILLIIVIVVIMISSLRYSQSCYFKSWCQHQPRMPGLDRAITTNGSRRGQRCRKPRHFPLALALSVSSVCHQCVSAPWQGGV